MNKLNIHMVVVAYGLPEDLRLLFERSRSRHRLHWHLFRHSKIPAVVDVCDEIAAREDVTYYPYGVNRGVPRSTNEGIVNAYAAGADVVITVADDMLPSWSDIDLLAGMAYGWRGRYGLVRARAYDVRTAQYIHTALSFTAWTPRGLNEVGLLDENIFPCYFEDNDMWHRLKLAGVPVGMCEETQIIHGGSKNIYSHPALMAQNHRTFEANKAYYVRKWGGMPDMERFERPFDDARFDHYIGAEVRAAPYPGHNRDEDERAALVKI